MATRFEPRERQPGGRSTEVRVDIRLDDVRFGARPDAQLFAAIAESKAQKIADSSREDKKNEPNKSSQLRRFYDELVMWHEKVASSDEEFERLQPYIYMLKAKVAYAKGRRRVDGNFEALFSRVIDQCTDAATLRQAKLFMEAFMAFYKVHNNK